jgi:flagellar hook-basal body complex protein FliE
VNSLFGGFAPIMPSTMNPVNNPYRSDPADAMSGAKLAPEFRQKIAETGAENATSFQKVLGNTLQSVNATLQEPDALMHQALTTGGVDVHDVMVANAKAELLINVTTQVATKVIQAYDRILQIQI